MKLTKKQMSEDGFMLKWNAIEIAKHHKRYCKKGDCNVSLIMLGLLIEKAGIELTKKQWGNFA